MKTVARGACATALILLLTGTALAQQSSGSSSTGTAASPAMGPNQGMTSNGTARATGTTAGKGDVSAKKAARADVAFMKQAAENGHAEVESSKLALQKGSDPQVKSFAQMMVDEHTKANTELMALATSKGVELPDGPSVMQKAKLKLLDASNGAGFDRRYSETIGLAAHRDTIALFQKASTNSKDADVKAFATKMLPSLKHHLEMAGKLPASERRQDKTASLR